MFGLFVEKDFSDAEKCNFGVCNLLGFRIIQFLVELKYSLNLLLVNQ